MKSHNHHLVPRLASTRGSSKTKQTGQKIISNIFAGNACKNKHNPRMKA